LPGLVEARYAGWNDQLGREILQGKLSLEQISQQVAAKNIDPKPRSGRQEMLENLVSRYL
jgi:xylose isomerase